MNKVKMLTVADDACSTTYAKKAYYGLQYSSTD